MSKKIPRCYQQGTVDSLIYSLTNSNDNGIAILPTGTGKALIIALLIHELFRRFGNLKVMMLTHSKELIGQNANELLEYWDDAPLGVYSSGLKSWDMHSPIIFGGIQSVINKKDEFGKVDLVIVDEAHLVSPNEETRYLQFFNALKKDNPNVRIQGLTATPWRLDQGHICEDGGIFNTVCFDMSTLEGFNWLFDEGYLCKLIPMRTKTKIDLSEVGTSVGVYGKDYKKNELQDACDQDEITQAALQEAVTLASDRKCWLVFTTGISHAENVNKRLNELGIKSTVVHSKEKDSDNRIKAFKNGEYTALVNADKLTTGFDHKPIDLIVMLRPTMSVSLWIQMLGRGTRCVYHPKYSFQDLIIKENRLKAIQEGGKHNCLVLDYGGNTKRLGPINDPLIPNKKGKGGKGGMAPIKECPQCQAQMHLSAKFCDNCGFEFKTQSKLKTQSSSDELIVKSPRKKEKAVVEWLTVKSVIYTIHKKVGKPNSLRVTYACEGKSFTEYVLVEHKRMRDKYRGWWRQRSQGMSVLPSTTESAYRLSNTLLKPKAVEVWINNHPYPTILGYKFRD